MHDSSPRNDVYDPQVVERDFNSLWNTGYFENIQIERDDTPKCVQLVIVVSEKPTIREINYKGLNAVTLSDVLERYKKAKVRGFGREPVRPDEDRAGGDSAAGFAGGARTSVRNDYA